MMPGMLRSAGFLACTLILTASALGQPPGGGPPPGMGKPVPLIVLLGQPSVQRELQLTAQQVQQANQTLTRTMAEVRRLSLIPLEKRENKVQELTTTSDQAASDLLRAPQQQRLQEISLQHQGAHAYSDARIVRELALTDDQQFTVGIIQEEIRGGVMQLMKPNQPANVALLRKKTVEMSKLADEKFQKQLTEVQKEKWKELLGPPFSGEIRPPAPAGPSGRPPRR